MEAFVTEAFTLLGIGLLVIGLRLYVRVSLGGFKGLHADDYLMVCIFNPVYVPLFAVSGRRDDSGAPRHCFCFWSLTLGLHCIKSTQKGTVWLTLLVRS